MNKKEITLIVIMVLLSIVLVIGSTYAFFIANVTGNTSAEDITIASGYLELTFKEDDNNITMEDVLPGNQDEKTFTVTNTSTADTSFTYNIKLAEAVTDFEQKDLEYTLQEYTNENYDTPKEEGTKATGFINKDTIKEGEMYLAININAPEKGEKQYYKLTIEFKETNENQDYNKGKSFVGKINGDDVSDAKLYQASSLLEICSSNDPLNECLAKGEKLKNIYADDPASNIRYAGSSDEVNNYIWFNCDDYNFASAEEATGKNCEKWRIIGLFKNVTKTEGGQEDLVKIIRSDSIGDIVWDSAEGSNWTAASLQTSLNTTYYNGGKLSSGKGITAQTKNMIEYVNWNIGGGPLSAPTADQMYTEERGTTTYGSWPSRWSGYIGLMYPSDYGYATVGSDSGADRDTCLTTNLRSYGNGCYQKNWLYISGVNQWTITLTAGSYYTAYNISSTGYVNAFDHNATSMAYSVRPALYLKSNVQIVGGKGSSSEPYILFQEA